MFRLIQTEVCWTEPSTQWSYVLSWMVHKLQLILASDSPSASLPGLSYRSPSVLGYGLLPAYAHVLLVPSLTGSTLWPCGSPERPAPCLFHQGICSNSDILSASYPICLLVPLHRNIQNARFPLWSLLSKNMRSSSNCVQCSLQSTPMKLRTAVLVRFLLSNEFRSKNKAK